MKEVILPVVDKKTTITLDSIDEYWNIYATIRNNHVAILCTFNCFCWNFNVSEKLACKGTTLQEALNSGLPVYQFDSYEEFAQWLIEYREGK